MEERKAIGFLGSGVLGGLVGVKEQHSPTPSNGSTPSPLHTRPVAEESVSLARVERGGGLTSDGIGAKQASVIGGSNGGMGSTEGKSVTTAAPREQGMGMEMGTDMTGGLGGSFSGGTDELFRKKRGRPRRYSSDHMALALTPESSCPFCRTLTSPANGVEGGHVAPANVSYLRPLVSFSLFLCEASLGEWFQLSAGGNFTPHVVTVAPGEDVAARILTFSQKGPRAICILSANGAISNVTLRQPGSSGGTLMYEGRFEILSLSGSFTITRAGGIRSRTGGISVSLAGPDGRVVGGGVAGLLLAASPIQVVVGSFLPNAFKENRRETLCNSQSFTAMLPATIITNAAASESTQNEEFETTKSSLQEAVPVDFHINVKSNPDLSLESLKAVGWQGLHTQSVQKFSPDINLSIHEE
ncbi:hypothetical protein HPP92_024379 [Vanilla planifolia]|uniref:AT-hook motif nuclear-localized protein n=1 Tax=Vanilla planifolia TaxID=51239 RepID=A0A835PP50_VANPL|nr:hypothetical protein HPP92_024379 [Vanilla planifolia]